MNIQVRLRMRVTYRDRVADYLRSNAGRWVDGLVLQDIGGRYAWRSRISDCRLDLGMTVENRQRKEGQRTISEYRYVPPVVLNEQPSLWSLIEWRD